MVVAWVLVRHHFPGKALLNGLVDLPFVVSPVIVGFVMIVLFGRQGWLKDLPFQIAFAFPGMLLVTVFVSLPFVIREVMPVLAALTPEQEEAALTLGASRWTVFRRIVFPAIRHGADLRRGADAGARAGRVRRGGGGGRRRAGRHRNGDDLCLPLDARPQRTSARTAWRFCSA